MHDDAVATKPILMVHKADLTATAAALCPLLATCDDLFDRGVPVRVVMATGGRLPLARPISYHGVAICTHRLCQPVVLADGQRREITLPDRVSKLYLEMHSDWGLRPLAGISTSPLLAEDGAISTLNGYDHRTQLLSVNAPPLMVPMHPAFEDAFRAMRLLRHTFRTFPFADATLKHDDTLGVVVVDIDHSPGRDESAFIVALLTACARASLWLAPGFLLTAPAISGAGTGKGLLARSICAIAHGIQPHAFTSGGGRQELEKQIGAELIEAQPALFLDNANGIALRSDTLASVMTERPSRIRLLGKSEMVTLNAVAFVIVTGNGLTITEDLARRFINCELDARCEDPETRPFTGGFLERVTAHRKELLTAVLTIWRWGRQNVASLNPGIPLGGFETWAAWCRDPLLALGCRDPVERIAALKATDPRRLNVAAIFEAWEKAHQDHPVRADGIHNSVRTLLDPQGRGRQFVVAQLQKLVGTRVAGYTLTAQQSPGKWGAATYKLRRTNGGP